jgi:hypothetical protein
MNIIKAIKSNKSAFWQTLLGTTILAPNVYYVFYKIISWGVDPATLKIPYILEAHAVAVAIYVSWSIMYNTMKKQINMALYFCYFEIMVSGCNYIIRLMFDAEGNFYFNGYIIMAMAFTIMLPMSVKAYAATIKDDEEEEKPGEKLYNDLKSNYVEINNILQAERAAGMDRNKYIDHLEKEVRERDGIIKMQTEAMEMKISSRGNLLVPVADQLDVKKHFKPLDNKVNEVLNEAADNMKETTNFGPSHSFIDPQGATISPDHLQQIESAKNLQNKEVKIGWKDETEGDFFSEGVIK